MLLTSVACDRVARVPRVSIRLVRRDDSPAARGRGFGPLLSFDLNIGLTKRRLPGALPWAAGPARQGLLVGRVRVVPVRHLRGRCCVCAEHSRALWHSIARVCVVFAMLRTAVGAGCVWAEHL